MRTDITNPFVGLRPFESDESLLFFGMQDLTLELLQRLHKHHFVAVVGGSGCGKSSLIRAGLIPSLIAGYLVDDCDRWAISVMKPGGNPLYNLAEAILNQLQPNGNISDVTAFLNRIKEEGADAILNVLQPLWTEQNTNFFLLVDQFEELFRFSMEHKDVAQKDEAIDFVNIILELSRQKGLPLYVVITMRSDFIGDCAQFYGLPEAMNQSQYLVPRLNRVQLKTVIEGPVKLFGGSINPALTSRLLNELGKVKDELPLLQHALMRIWNFEMKFDKSGELDLHDYEKIGGMEKALSLHADEALEGMNEEELLLTKKIFQALTAIDENGRKIRRPVKIGKLKELTGASEDQILKIINLFINDNRSFLIINKAGVTGDSLIDISHESLIRQWNTLGHWVDEEGESVSKYLQLAGAAKLYQQKKKDLLTGSELQIALEWRDSFKPLAAWANRYKEGFEESIEYLNESESERKKQLNFEKARKQKQRYLVNSVIGLLFLVAISSGVFAIYFSRQKEKADSSTRIALLEKANAVCSAKRADYNARVALSEKAKADFNAKVALIQESLARYSKMQAEISMDNANRSKMAEFLARIKADSSYNVAIKQTIIADSMANVATHQKEVTEHQKEAFVIHARTFGIINNDPTLALRLEEAALMKDTDAIFQNAALKIYLNNSFYKIVVHQLTSMTCVASSPDGKRILTGSYDNTVRLWDSFGKTIQVFKGLSSPITSVTFSPDGKTILTGSFDKTARLWDLQGNTIQVFKGHKFKINSVAFSPDGKTILTGSDDKTAMLWDLHGNPLHEFEGHDGAISAVAFSPDGKTILTACSRDFTARLWQVKGKSLKKIHTNSGIFSIAFSPDGNTILTGLANGKVYLWDLKGHIKSTLGGLSGYIKSIAFSPDGKTLITGSSDKTARLWDLNGNNLQVFKGHTDQVIFVSFSPDGKKIFTASPDQTVRLWGLNENTVQKYNGHAGHILSVAFSRDGTTILTGSVDKTARLWDLKGDTLREFKGHTDILNAVAFSPDGTIILTGSADKTARLWDLHGNTICKITGHSASINSVAFSPDGNTVLTGSKDSTVRLWDKKGNLLHLFSNHTGIFYSVAFSPDGKTILTGSSDNTARLWDLNGNLLQEFSGHLDDVCCVAFSPDGKTILTGSFDATARLWDLSGKTKQVFNGHTMKVNSIAYSPDGKSILTGSNDNMAFLWDLNGNELKRFIGHSKYITSVAFSPNGNEFLTGSWDNSARLWEISALPLKDFLKLYNIEPLSLNQKEKYGIK